MTKKWNYNTFVQILYSCFRYTGRFSLGCALFVARCNIIRVLWETKKKQRLSYRKNKSKHFVWGTSLFWLLVLLSLLFLLLPSFTLLCKWHTFWIASIKIHNIAMGGILSDVKNQKISCNLKLVSAIFSGIFIFSRNDSPSKTVKKCFLFHLKSSFHSRDIQIFVIFPISFHTFQIQKNKWKWNNLWCHELACINLQV